MLSCIIKIRELLVPFFYASSLKINGKIFFYVRNIDYICTNKYHDDMKTVKLEELREILQMEKAHFEYKKKDGTLREAFGTLQFAYIPEDQQPKSNSDYESKNFRYFDLDKNAWRSISGDITDVSVF
jgi:hypothetical protein